MIGEVTYSYQPDGWSQERFLAAGGFTVVFLNYNKKFLIEKSVRSALDQDYPILEMFFMDDASSDGSGDIMEEIVRAYRGRHKVSVVRNAENQYITGQWNIVSKLATGNWFGMFCGDDVAHLDRVSLVAERIRKYPTLRGISTAAVNVDPTSLCSIVDAYPYVKQPYIAKGDDSWSDLAANFNSNGSTSFWHRSLFSTRIPRVPLDDNYIHFRLFAMNRGVKSPVYLYDSSIKTINYTIGVGVCSEGRDNGGGTSKREQWVSEIRCYKVFLSKLAATMQRSIEDAKMYGIERREMMPFLFLLWWCRIRAANTIERGGLVPSLVIFLLFGRAPVNGRARLLRMYAYFFVFEFLGLTVASCIREIRLFRKYCLRR